MAWARGVARTVSELARVSGMYKYENCTHRLSMDYALLA